MRTLRRHTRRLLVAILVTLAASSCGCAQKKQPGAAAPAPETIRPEIIRQFPHDPRAFTQGLLYAAGRLYESTGAPQGLVSSLRVVDTARGDVIKSLPLADMFAEGIAVMGDMLLQLTWRDGMLLTYSFPSLVMDPLPRPLEGEGWGLASDGKLFYMSSGSDTIQVRDAAFGLRSRVAVRMNGKPVRSLNELEFARGMLYANIWYSNLVAEIDPGSGLVRRVIDCSELVTRAAPSDAGYVLNGIAYNPERGTFYMTGKCWSVMFEVRIPQAARGGTSP
jgi:glutamine cyclotransferase